MIPSEKKEYGKAIITPSAESALFKGVDNFTVWMSHGDQVSPFFCILVFLASGESFDSSVSCCTALIMRLVQLP